MKITIRNILLNGKEVDIKIRGNRIEKIGRHLVPEGELLEGKGKAAIPGLVNGHTHAAMSLFRGFGDDLFLEEWLQKKIWPYEKNLTEEAVYWGTCLACLEMIKSGTTSFNDMYYYFNGIARAAERMGIRAWISSVVFDRFDPSLAEKSKRQSTELFEKSKDWGSNIHLCLGPHALYTVSGETLRWCQDFASKNQLLIHTHLAETQTEDLFAREKFGLSPVQYLHELGLLSPRLLAAHCLWLDEVDIQLLGENQCRIIHNPNSNMKLASGYQFRFEELKKAGAVIGLGTDGCSSSNNLDMLESTKTAALLQKAWRGNPTTLGVEEAFHAATEVGEALFDLKIGKVEEGYLADIALIDLNSPAFTPNHHFLSNLVYAANGSCVDSLICDGKIIMRNRYVEGEEEILYMANKIAKGIFK